MLGNKLCVILHRRLLQDCFAKTDVANVVCYTSYIMLMVTWCRSECCVFQNLTSKPLTIESKNKCLVMF